MVLLLSPTTSSLLSSNHCNSISSSTCSRSLSSRRKHKKDDASSSFRNIDDVLASFNQMLHNTEQDNATFNADSSSGDDASFQGGGRVGQLIPSTVIGDHTAIRKGRIVLRDDDFPVECSWYATRSRTILRMYQTRH
ncbi:hypothetical protein SADUNF_Sadunf06G0194500 [Salix dunnii]|uniref:Uncharacterized protein n=1 Tax=Salix dunnii TaxID=1413687 RepID=A0A835MXQ6_9ROSI|nr:hypothetical protein SADUNF_Sadunf06G0194500 [Salix dunnii]